MSAPRLSYKPKDAGALVGLSESTIKREIRAGRLKAKQAGGCLLIDAAALREWFDNLPDAEAAS